MTLDNPGPGVPREPDVAMDAQGRVMVVWLQAQGGSNRVWARRFDPATGWAPAEVLDAAAVGTDHAPRVAVHRNGSALVAWLRDLPGSRPIMSRAFQPGQGWGPERQLGNPGSARPPVVALDGQGRGVVVWPQRDIALTGPRPLWGRDFELTTGDGTTTPVEQVRPNASLPQLVTLDDGSVLLAWRAERSLSSSSQLVGTSQFNPGVGWSQPLQPSGIVTEVSTISLAAGHAGTSAVMWTEEQGGRHRLALNRQVGAQVSSSTPMIVVDEPGTVRLVPQVVLDASGRAIWIWQQGPAGASALWASDQVDGIAPASPVRLDQGTSAGASSAGLALRVGDEAFAVWTQNTASGARIWAARRIP